MTRRRRSRRDPARSYLDRLAPAGRAAQASAVRLIRELVTRGRGVDRFPGWSRLAYRDAAAVRAQLLRRELAPATVRRVLAALRGVAREAWRLEMLSTDAYARIASVEGVSGRGLSLGRCLDDDEVDALFEACAADGRSVGARDGAALALMYSAGLRRQEAASLKLDQVDLADGALRLVETKRHEARTTFLGAGLELVARWLEVRGTSPGPLLWRALPVGAVVAEAVSADALYRLTERRAREAGIERCTPHDLRRTHITLLLQGGVDPLQVGRMVGHRHTDTTKLYDRRGEDEARRAVELVRAPGSRRGVGARHGSRRG